MSREKRKFFRKMKVTHSIYYVSNIEKNTYNDILPFEGRDKIEENNSMYKFDNVSAYGMWRRCKPTGTYK